MEQQEKRRSSRKGNKCCDCEHVIFDETWGEYTKCRLLKRRIEKANSYTGCKDFKRATTSKE